MSYATIIAAIDAAIENWCDKPISLTINNRTVTYRSLTELIKARQEYASLLRTQSGGVGFQIHHIEAGGAG